MILIIGSALHGQMLDEVEFEQMQARRSMVKRAMMDQFIELEGDSAVSFWAVYEEYEQKRLQLGKDRMAFLHEYIRTYKQMDEADTDLLMKKMISSRKTYHGLVDKYYKKVRSISDARVAAQFYQLEYYYLNLTRVAILDEMPFFGEEDL